MVDFGKSDKMIKLSGKVTESNTYNGFSSNISFFIQWRTSSDEQFKKNFSVLPIEEIDKIMVNT